MDLKERTRWAICFIAKKKKLSNLKIGKIIGVKADTVNGYRSKLVNPKVDFIIKFCDAFDIDILWFTKGEGEPFHGANNQFPEVCSPSRYETGQQDGIQKPSVSRSSIPLPSPKEEYNFEKNIVINLTEKSLVRLCKLIGFPISRGWKSALAGFLDITPAQLSNAISRDRISKNLLIKIGEKGYPAEHWLVRQARKKVSKDDYLEEDSDVEKSLWAKSDYLPSSAGELLKMAESVLHSETAHATTLAMNIVSLSIAVTAERKLKKRSMK